MQRKTERDTHTDDVNNVTKFCSDFGKRALSTNSLDAGSRHNSSITPIQPKRKRSPVCYCVRHRRECAVASHLLPLTYGRTCVCAMAVLARESTNLQGLLAILKSAHKHKHKH